jgi:hypothetical protein
VAGDRDLSATSVADPSKTVTAQVTVAKWGE